MDLALTLENLYHEVMLREARTEESKEWECMRHEIMSESIHDTIKYYAERYHEEELER